MEDDSSDRTPGDETPPETRREGSAAGLRTYLTGLALAGTLTAVSFWVAGSSILWQPGVAVGLAVLAITQMGVHLVFFLHITTGPDNTNNVLALAFGILIVGLIVVGSLWIMAHLAANVMPAAGVIILR